MRISVVKSYVLTVFMLTALVVGAMGPVGVGATPVRQVISSDTLNPGDGLGSGQIMKSKNGSKSLIMQTDGNLVLYGPESIALWDSGTSGKPGATAIMQTDGNFVIYQSGRPLWASSTYIVGSRLVVHDDGRIAIETPDGRNVFDRPKDKTLRVMEWNIQEGNGGGNVDNSQLHNIADQIRSLNPDIVLLNEVIFYHGWPFSNGVNQASELANLTGVQHVAWAHTTQLGLTGHKGVAILSQYSLPLGPASVYEAPGGFGTLDVPVTLDAYYNVIHVLSTRFAPRSSPQSIANNSAGISQAIGFISKLNDAGSNTPIPLILGGDFNAERSTPDITNFIASTGLRDAFAEKPDPQICGDPNKRIDFIFYRGPYQVRLVQQRCPWSGLNNASDHPWLYAELSTMPTHALVVTVQLVGQPAGARIPLGVPVSVVVNAADFLTGAPVSGDVAVDNPDSRGGTTTHFATNTPTTVTFSYYKEPADCSGRSPGSGTGCGSGNARTDYPTVTVRVSGYPDISAAGNPNGGTITLLFPHP